MQRETRRAIVEDDCFGLSTAPLVNARFFGRPEERLRQFVAWLQTLTEANLLEKSLTGGAWFADIIGRAFRQGAERAFLEVHRVAAALAEPTAAVATRAAFAAELLARGEVGTALSLLVEKTLGLVTAAVGRAVAAGGTAAASGLGGAASPAALAADVVAAVGRIEKDLAGIAETGVIGPFAEGSRQAYKALGTTALRLEVETAKAGVCENCVRLAGRTYTIEEAFGLIPLHPWCRCILKPAPAG